MMKHKQKITAGIFLLLMVLVFSACSPAASEPTGDPNAIYTQAAATVHAQLTGTAMALPTATETPEPTPTEALPTVTPTIELEVPTEAAFATLPATSTSAVATQLPVFPTNTPVKTIQGDGALYQYQTHADGTTFSGGEAFLLAWGFKNIGTTTWTTDYKWVFVGGKALSGVASGNLENEVAPGEKYEFNLAATAPSEPGEYTTYWNLVNSQGVFIEQFYFYFKVQ